jgi:predicted Zn-dependent protease with MMP-like domain
MRTSQNAILRARRKRFAGMVEEAVRSLHPSVQAALRNVAITVEDSPSEQADHVGLYEGIPQSERESGSGLLPDRIVIYRMPMEESAVSAADLREQIRITVLHEIGHHFGLDEEQLDAIGLA